MSALASADSVYRVVYDVRQAWPNGLWIIFPFGSVAGIGAWLARDQAKNEDSDPKLWLMALGALGVGGCGVLFILGFSVLPYFAMRISVAHGDYEIREGVVHNFVPGDPGAHQQECWVLHTTKGDFAYAYSPSLIDAGYEQTAADGGRVSEGAHVRVFDVRGRIAHLEVSLPQAAAQPPNPRLQLPGAGRPGLRPVLSAAGGQRNVEFGWAGVPPAAEPQGR